MKFPDTIYIHEASASELALPRKDYHLEYIRKDALLEWAKAKKAELLNEELTDVAAGINMGMDMLIYKLEQL